MVTVIKMTLTTPEDNEMSVNARVHQITEKWKEFHPDNTIQVEISLQKPVPEYVTSNQEVGESASVTQIDEDVEISN